MQNIEYTYAIRTSLHPCPASIIAYFALASGTLVAGSNTLTITVASGSSGETFLVRLSVGFPSDEVLTLHIYAFSHPISFSTLLHFTRRPLGCKL